jgi:hypothetical protein
MYSKDFKTSQELLRQMKMKVYSSPSDCFVRLILSSCFTSSHEHWRDGNRKWEKSTDFTHVCFHQCFCPVLQLNNEHIRWQIFNGLFCYSESQYVNLRLLNWDSLNHFASGLLNFGSIDQQPTNSTRHSTFTK